ncbi:hypothetical protein WA026_009070, partial [Henosepilachna vigintioctopunctata]
MSFFQWKIPGESSVNVDSSQQIYLGKSHQTLLGQEPSGATGPIRRELTNLPQQEQLKYL